MSPAWTLRDRLLNALAEHEEHRELFLILTASLRGQNIAQWKAQIEAWERDPSLPDPYQTISDGEFFRSLPLHIDFADLRGRSP